MMLCNISLMCILTYYLSLTPSLHSNAYGKQEYKHAVFDQINSSGHFASYSSITPLANADPVSASVTVKVDRFARKLLRDIHATNKFPVLGEILNMTCLPSVEQKRADDRQSARKSAQITHSNNTSVHPLSRISV